MFHLIEFKCRGRLDVQRSPQHRLERLFVQSGDQLCVRVRPYTHESAFGPVEVADLYLDDSTTLCAVPFACFRFLDAAGQQD